VLRNSETQSLNRQLRAYFPLFDSQNSTEERGFSYIPENSTRFLRDAFPILITLARPVQISEIFESIQGEGPWAETRSLFVRTSGCNLRCWFCDTPYTSWQPDGTSWTLGQLCLRIEQSPAPDVVITGGEPMLVEQVVPLTEFCRSIGKRITIETAGTIDRPVISDLMAISPKLKNSIPTDAVWTSRHDRTRHQPDVIHEFLRRYNAILKFVVDSEADLQEIETYLQEFPESRPDQVWLMPQARTREQLAEKVDWVRQAAVQHGFQFSSRLHIERFGNRRGT
jgi:7-carboxy-7-deazaguanine synthase